MTEATSKALDTISRLALCGQSCYEECLFNPDGVCLRPLLKLKPAVVTDDVCDSFISNAPGSIGSIGNVFCGSKNSAEAETSDPELSVRQAAALAKQTIDLYCNARLRAGLCLSSECFPLCPVPAFQSSLGEQQENVFLGAIVNLDGSDRMEFLTISELKDAVNRIGRIGANNSKVVEIYCYASGAHFDTSWLERIAPPVLVRYVTDPHGKTL